MQDAIEIADSSEHTVNSYAIPGGLRRRKEFQIDIGLWSVYEDPHRPLALNLESELESLTQMPYAKLELSRRWQDLRQDEYKRLARKTAQAALVRANLEQTFQELAERWSSETRLLSSLTDKVLHPAYQDIIGLGPDAVPLLLRELQHNSGHWFWALSHITREDPINPEDAGNVRKMTEAWLEWGRERDYINDDMVGKLFS